jgi:uncharacterized membrane protein YeaQ/YmgE (transglycosylase-associated protein family)
MGIALTILIGFFAGLIARLLTPGRQALGFFITAVLGIAGSLLATYVGQVLGWYTAGAGAGFVASVVGAVVVLAIYGVLSRRA